MKVEYKIFTGVATFLVGAALLYGFWTHYATGHMDWIGTVALVMSALLCTMCGGYFWFVSRRIDPRPEDRNDAEIVEGAGEIGFFSPGSYWPFGIALAVALAGIGIVFWIWWLIAAGLITVLFGVAGLLFEYYTGARREH